MTIFVIMLLAAHFIGDWVFQSRKMALAKSKNINALFAHLSIVTACLAVVAVPYVGLVKGCVALSINAILHGLIDWNGWTFYKKRFSSLTIEEHFSNYWFYTTIAIDQFLHLALIFILFLP